MSHLRLVLTPTLTRASLLAFAIMSSFSAGAAPDDRHILLNSGTVDSETAARAPIEPFEGSRLFLVQFDGAIQPQWLDALRADGVRVVNYLPNFAYLVWADAAAMAQVQDRAASDKSAIVWVGGWRDEYKLNPNVWRNEKELNQRFLARQSDATRFEVQLVSDRSSNLVTLEKLQQLGGRVLFNPGSIEGFENFVVELAPEMLQRFAEQNDVVSIYRYVEPTRFDERQAIIVGGDLLGNGARPGNYFSMLASWGFTPRQFRTSGFVVDVTDDGADINPAGGILSNDMSGPVAANHFVLFESGDRPIGIDPPSGISRFVQKGRWGTGSTADGGVGLSGHGQLNMSIVGGFVPSILRSSVLFGAMPHADSRGFRYGLGIAPYVRMANSVIFDPAFTAPSFPTMLARNHELETRVSSNSWGTNVSGVYNANAQTYDGLVRDSRSALAGNQEMVVVFAAGNSGPNPTTIGSPATAKNVITAGAAEGVQPFGGADGCGTNDAGADSANDIIGFSSRGPTTDLRVKPDIVAPGTHISGMALVTPTSTGLGTRGVGFRGDGVCGGVGSPFFPAGQFWYSASSGTSHSTPAIAGGAALVYQQFINNPAYLANRTPSSGAPSPALVKAYLANSARYMTGVSANDSLPSPRQGLGMMNLGLAFDETPRMVRDQVAADRFTASAQVRTFNGVVNSSAKPVRVTLVWSDAPGATSGNSYVNNLDLSVTVGGNTYLGNNFTGAHSITGGSADVRNNIESVLLPAGVSGVYTITVTATNIAGSADPVIGGLNQDFALVAYNVGPASSCPVNLALAPSTLPSAAIGTAYVQSFSATGGTAPYTYAVSGGALPNGVTLTGAALGDAPLAGSDGLSTFAVSATDANGCRTARTYSIPVSCAALNLTPATVPASAIISSVFPSTTFTTTGGAGPYTYELLGGLPTGMTLVNGTLSGTPTTRGIFNFSVLARDSNQCFSVRTFPLTVVGSEVTLGARQVTSGNTIVEPNECNLMNVALNNIGDLPATAISSTLSSATPGVSIVGPTTLYPNMAAGSGALNSSPFQFSTSNALTCGSSIAFTQTVNFGGGLSPTTFNYTLPVGQFSENYVFTTDTGAAIPAGGTLIAGSAADDVIVSTTTPFAFSVYGNPVASGQTIRVSSNGNVQFIAAGGSSSLSNVALPATLLPAATNVLFAFWDDLNLSSAGGGIYSTVDGVAPNRKYILEWRGRHFSEPAPTQTVNFAIVFTEGSDGFEYRYLQTGTLAAIQNGASATTGVQFTNSGTRFSQYSFNPVPGTITPGLVIRAALPPAICSPGPAQCASDLIFANGFQ